MPYLEESFYGMTDTARALRNIAASWTTPSAGWKSV